VIMWPQLKNKMQRCILNPLLNPYHVVCSCHQDKVAVVKFGDDDYCYYYVIVLCVYYYHRVFIGVARIYDWGSWCLDFQC